MQSDDEEAICAVIIPVLNAEKYLAEALQSVLSQEGYPLRNVELIIYNDGSTDNTLAVAESLRPRLTACLSRFVLLSSNGAPSGAGSARNRCVEATRAPILVFLDADDAMTPTRLARTCARLSSDTNSRIVLGGNFERIPAGSTPRYEAFHRRLCGRDVASLAFAFRDAALAMPTLACTRAAWAAAKGFVEGRGVPEDMHFIYDAMESGASLIKLEGEPLTRYRYHAGMVSWSYGRKQLLEIRVAAFERLVLRRPGWREGFSVWGAGRDGKQFFGFLSEEARVLVKMWGDVDPRKIGQTLRGRPVVHFSKLVSPIALCVAMDRDGQFERNLATLGLEGGVHYFHIV